VLDDEALGPDEALLDVGCGKGRAVFEAALRPGFRRILGIDVTPELVEAAKRNLLEAAGACAARRSSSWSPMRPPGRSPTT